MAIRRGPPYLNANVTSSPRGDRQRPSEIHDTLGPRSDQCPPAIHHPTWCRAPGPDRGNWRGGHRRARRRRRALGGGVVGAYTLAALGVVCLIMWTALVGWAVGVFLWETRDRQQGPQDRRAKRPEWALSSHAEGSRWRAARFTHYTVSIRFARVQPLPRHRRREPTNAPTSSLGESSCRRSDRVRGCIRPTARAGPPVTRSADAGRRGR